MKAKNLAQFFEMAANMDEIKKVHFKSRNMKQILHMYNDCMRSDEYFRRMHIFKHPMIQKEIVKYKREIRRRVSTLKGKDLLRNIKVLKF